jgi:RES domain-containing protein
LLKKAALRAALGRAPLSLFVAELSHIALYKWRRALLSEDGAKDGPGRYHVVGGAPAVYFADNPVTALYEVGRIFGARYATVAPPGILLSVRIQLSGGVLDLRDGKIQSLLGTSRQELTGHWISGTVAPTQLLGETAHELGNVVALQAPSAADPNGFGENVVVFKDRLRLVGGKIEIYDPENWLASSHSSGAKSKTRR